MSPEGDSDGMEMAMVSGTPPLACVIQLNMFVAACMGHSWDSDMWQVAVSLGKKRVVLPLLLQACSGLGNGCDGKEPVQSWLQSDGRGDSKALSTDTAASGSRPSSSPFIAASFSLEGV